LCVFCWASVEMASDGLGKQVNLSVSLPGYSLFPYGWKFSLISLDS